MKPIEIDIDAITTKFDNKLKGVINSVEGVSDKMSRIGGMMSLAVTAPLLVAAKSMVKFASNSEESLNKVNVAFGKSSESVQEFSRNSLESFGFASSTALEMASNFGDMATSMGLNQQTAAQLSTSLVGLSGDLSSFKNIAIDQAQTALTGVFTGETESLKKLGVVMTEANLQAFAFSKGIKANVQDLSESEKVLLRYNFIMEKTKNAQGDFARTGGGAANQMRYFQEILKEIGTSFGSIILPYFTKGLTYVNGLLKAFNGLGGTAKTAILAITGIIAAAGPILAITKYVVNLGSYLKYLVTPIGLFGIAMGAAAIYTMTHWEKVRQFFYDFEVQFFKFKQALGTGLYMAGVIDAKTAFGDIGDGLKNISRWSEDSKVGVQGFVNDVKKGAGELNNMLANIVKGPKGKGGDKKEKIFDWDAWAADIADTKKWLREKTLELTELMKLKNRDEVIKHNQEFAREAIKGALENSLFNDTSNAIEENMKKNMDAVGKAIKSSAPPMVTDAFLNAMEIIKMKAEDMGKEFANAVNGAITVGLNGFGDLVQASLMKGDKKMNFKRVFANLLGTIGDLMIELGKKAVMINIAFESIKFPTGAAGVALGLGLIAAGGALKAASSNINTNANSNVNSSKSSTFTPNYGASNLTVNVVGSLKGEGTSIVATLNNTASLYGI